MNSIDKFLEFEDEQNVFEITVDGILIWERIRSGIFRRFKRQSGAGKAHTSIDTDSRKDQIKGMKLCLRNLFYRNPFFADSSDILFIGHHRRKKKSDGYWWDVYCDPIHNNCSLESVHFEMPYQLDHLTPAKTDSIRYLELIHYSGTIQRKLGLHQVSLSVQESKCLENLNEELENQLNINVQLKKLVVRVLQNRRCRLWLYERLLDNVDPKIAVVVVSYGNQVFIEACKRNNIPVVELQHGVIHKSHIDYSFPGDRIKKIFPDYLLTWGEFWSDDIELPIPDDRVIPVGYPYLEQSKKLHENVEDDDKIIFISQGTIGAKLSKFAIEVADHPLIDSKIVYKLHPGEYDRWEREYPWLVDAGITVIDSPEPPLYELFAESSVQIGVGSTAVYEGLLFGLETYVYDCEGSTILQPLVDEGSAEQISTVDQLVDSLGYYESVFDKTYYFSSCATQTMCNVISRLEEEGTTYSGTNS